MDKVFLPIIYSVNVHVYMHRPGVQKQKKNQWSKGHSLLILLLYGISQIAIAKKIVLRNNESKERAAADFIICTHAQQRHLCNIKSKQGKLAESDNFTNIILHIIIIVYSFFCRQHINCHWYIYFLQSAYASHTCNIGIINLLCVLMFLIGGRPSPLAFFFTLLQYYYSRMVQSRHKLKCFNIRMLKYVCVCVYELICCVGYLQINEFIYLLQLLSCFTKYNRRFHMRQINVQIVSYCC